MCIVLYLVRNVGEYFCILLAYFTIQLDLRLSHFKHLLLSDRDIYVIGF